jgi:hypothetical protein
VGALRLTYSLHGRAWLDLSYYLVVVIVLLNVIFGIIIDTFSELRNQKQERARDTLGRCFICGIDKHTFDSERPLQ